MTKTTTTLIQNLHNVHLYSSVFFIELLTLSPDKLFPALLGLILLRLEIFERPDLLIDVRGDLCRRFPDFLAVGAWLMHPLVFLGSLSTWQKVHLGLASG